MPQQVPSCTVCGGREFDGADGLYYCTICSTQSQAIRDEELEYREAYEGRFGGIKEVNTDKVNKEEKKKKDYGRPWRTHEAFQIILKEQIKAFIGLGAKPEVMDIAFRLWVKYLGKSGIAFTELVKQETDNRLLRGRSRDMFPGTVAEPRSKIIRYLVDRKRINPQFTTKRLLMQNELLEAMKAETFYEGDNRLADTDLTVAEMMERETKRQEECDKNKNSLMTDFEGLPIFADKADYAAEHQISYMTLSKLLCLAVLAVMYTNPLVTPSDVYQWIQDGRLPFKQVIDLLPDDMHFFADDMMTFHAKCVPTPEIITQLCGRLAVYLELDQFLSVDIGLLSSRYIVELNLPNELHGFVSNLLDRARPTIQLTSQRYSLCTNPSAFAMAYIIVALRLLFRLDDVTEKHWSEYGRLPSVRKRYDRPLFVWEDWVSAAEKRMIVNRAGYFPPDLKNLKTVVDIESALSHFNHVVEPHFRLQHSFRYSHLKFDHMVHMPEELRHLSQRANLSPSSDDSDVAHMWQKCPDKRCFSSRTQQHVNCFSASTVQYIVDCNLSSSLAHKDAVESSHSDNTSDVTDSSPPRKQPHLDVPTTETTVSGQQCNTSQTSDINSVEQAAPSVTSNAGPLLNSSPPLTVSSYPVYKLTNFDDRSHDVKSRPLSYRWLISHCANHIYAKPSIVERYVERLELLHIVPKDPKNRRDQSLRARLSNRFKMGNRKSRPRRSFSRRRAKIQT